MPSLDDPLKLRCGVILPNKIALAPLTNTQSYDDGTLSEEEYMWITHRGGHFGLISTCAAYVSLEGKAWRGQLGIADEEHFFGLRQMALGIRATQSVSMVQLHHAGNKASLTPQRISSSASDGVIKATIEDIHRIRDDFINASKLAERAGFDGIEVHGANGYIFTQFLAPADNTRDDEYGGSLENRARLLRETVQGIRKAVSEEFMVNVRISPVDLYDRKGLTLKDSLQVGKWLAEDGIDVLHLSLRNADGPAPFEDDKRSVVRAFRDTLPDDVKIEAAGGIWTREQANRALKEGADIIALGKSAIVHPDWLEASKSPDFNPMMPKWDPEYLKSVKVGPKFINYLLKFPGLLVGGAPARE
ncbi:MAG: NADH:flavin oxidoreductase [Candidatus Heimdallarchaeota archaeon]|nr:NADH:flavin oxidoreductase [Candidatus Heimdallarchaeota archaeon]